MSLKAVGIAVGCIACFAAGFGLAYYRGETQMREAELAAAVARANQGRSAYEKLVEAQDALDAARADRARDAREYAERLRKLDANRMRQASAAACRDERAAVARCEGLLKEGVALVGEGVGLLCRNADLHDAAVKTIK